MPRDREIERVAVFATSQGRWFYRDQFTVHSYRLGVMPDGPEIRAAEPQAPDRLDRRLDRLYAARFPDRERERKSRLWAVLCNAFFSRYVPADGTVVDLGAGYCDFINHVRASRRIAVDLNPDTARFAAPGVEVLAAPL